MKNPIKCLIFLFSNLKWTCNWQLHKNALQMNSFQSTKNSQNFLNCTSSCPICLSYNTQCISSPKPYSDIATLLSIEIAYLICAFLLCKDGPNSSQRNLNVLWDTRVICLNILSVNEPNKRMSMIPRFLSNAYTLTNARIQGYQPKTTTLKCVLV